MASPRAPKQWQLTENETINSFENWRQNLLYLLSLDKNFSPYLCDDFTWKKKTSIDVNRGLKDDRDPIPVADRKTAVQKNVQLELMLGFIANYCSVISRNSILKQSTSLNDIWQKIRQHYGFQSTGAHFLDLGKITLQPAEKPETLYQRIQAFYEDNLMTKDGGITHHGEIIPTDEDMTPTLENTIVFLWLQLINPGLPQLVKMKYGSDLRNKLLASLKPEISQAIPSLLDELRSMEDSRIMRTGAFNYNNKSKFSPNSRPFQRQRRKPKSCTLCHAAGRSGQTTHSLIECRYLPEEDRQAIGRTRLVLQDDDDDDVEQVEHDTSYSTFDPNMDTPPSGLLDQPTAMRVNIVQSPFLTTHYDSFTVKLTLDTGATTNLIRSSFAKIIGLPISPATQVAHQADGITPLHVTGEVHCQLTRNRHRFQLDALVVEQLDVDVLAGNPFLVTNDIATRPAKRQIVINGTEVIQYGSQPNRTTSVRRTQAFLLRCPSRQTLLPGDYVQLTTPAECELDAVLALEPRCDSTTNQDRKQNYTWPSPQEIQSVGHTLRVTNSTNEPLILKKHDHLCQVHPLVSAMPSTTVTRQAVHTVAAERPYSGKIALDPDEQLPSSIREEFKLLHQQFDDVFNPSIAKYNGASGKIEATVNMGPVLPPQRKGRLPHYNRDTLNQLQDKFDELEAAGVFAKPENVNTTVEYLNLSFLVKKPKGGHRLVTSFGEVGQYSKPQPSLMPNVDNVLRDIARWNYVITTDLNQAYYQIPLSAKSMKYCGVVTPFKGVRVYTRSAMGMPGSETCLEELMCRVLGDLIQEGFVTKIADDLYIGGDTPEETLINWKRTLEALHNNNLRLSAKKTTVCPQSTTILGWIWSKGSLSASQHRISALSSVEPPKTVQGLRSFIGAYKVLSRVLRGYANLIDPLDQIAAGKQSRDLINWSDEMLYAFKQAQLALKDNKTVTMPRPQDQLWIVTDGSIKKRGIAATLYTCRDNNLLLSGFFNAKLRKHQVTWLPCEIEALCISTAIKHFAPYIIQSKLSTQLLTDSRPCVQACLKLNRGEFSASSRVTTFLSMVSRYGIRVQHIAGNANIPTDYASRHPAECTDKTCQVCKFIEDTEDSVIRQVTISDVVEGSVKMPFTNHAAWMATQLECPDLRRTHSHLTQGTRPSKKQAKIPDVKRYLRELTVANDGLLVVKDNQPFQPTRHRIVVPRSVIDGLLTAIHLRFKHPTRHQMKRLVNRYFYALDMDKAIERTCSSCHHCSALRSVPTHLMPQSTSPPTESISRSFAADVMRRYRQCIFVLRETVSSFTLTKIISNEQHDQLRDAILMLGAEVRPLGDGEMTIRIDAAPGLATLVNDPDIKALGILLEIGNIKNINKNPVAENAIKELGLECLNINPEGGPLTPVTLALATANLNSRIRRGGLSAREIWTQRDQITGEQLPIDDKQLIFQQHFNRTHEHAATSKSKAHGKTTSPKEHINIGDLVYLYKDRDKTRGRDRYLVTRINDNKCNIRKFTQSQLRSKSYEVRLTDCYVVHPTILYDGNQGPIRGLHDHNEQAHDHRQLPSLPESPDINTPVSQYDTDNAAHPTPHHISLHCDNNAETKEALASNDQVTTPPRTLTRPPDISELGTYLPDTREKIPTTPTNITEENPVGSNTAITTRKSTRSHKPPSWQESGDWIMN